MTMRALRYFVPATLLLLCLAAQPAAAKRLDGVFTAVKNANVVVLDYGEGSYDVRIYGTEAPADGQPFAAEAKAFVREALLGKHGAMRFKYRNARGEMVARILYFDDEGRERDLSTDLAAAGLVWLRPGARYRPEIKGQPDQLTAAQTEAQDARRGVWSTDKPVAPWTFRGETLPPEPMTSGFPGDAAGNVDINISKLAGSDNECAIAKNPTNPLQLVAHCNSLDTPWRSTDGGLTWTLGGTIGSYCCDPNLAWDSYGNLFATFINSSLNAIVTKLSVDGGASWADLASFGGSIDQPSVVAHDGTVWIVWNSSGNMVASGAAVTGLGAVGAFSAPQTAPTTTSCSFGDLAVSPVAPHAVVQVCGPSGGQTGGNIRINVDADGLGAGGFGPSIVAAMTLVGGFDFIPAQNNRSIDTEAGLAFDRNPASPHFGRLYLLYTDELIQESSDTNILLSYSDDTGDNWSAPLQINTDATTRSQFLPKIASDPATGNVAICWHDARNSAANTAMEVWCDTFTPATFPALLGNVQVGDGASLSTDGSMDFGDYSGLTLGAGIAHPIWADSSNSTGDNPSGTSAFDTYTDRHSVLAADYTLGATPSSLSVCAPANAVYTVNVGAFGGYTDPVALGVAGNPAGTSAGFSLNPVTPAGSSTLTIGDTHLGTPGSHVVTVSASSTTGPKGVQVTLNLAVGVPATATLTAPADGATGISVAAPLSWSAVAGVAGYDVEVDEDSDFSSPEFTTTVSGTSTTATGLLADTIYFWRVKATNGCGGAFSAARSFRTAVEYCVSPGTAIPDNAPTGITSTIVIPASPNVVTDMNVLVKATHTWPGDLKFTLAHGGSPVAFYDRPGVPASTFGCSTDNIDVTINDEGVGNLESSCNGAAPGISGNLIGGDPASATLLQAFDGLSIAGTWTLVASDLAGGDTGTLVQWCLLPTYSAVDPLLFVDGFESNDTSAWSLTFP